MPDPFDGYTEQIRSAAGGFVKNATGAISRDEWRRLYGDLPARQELIKAVGKLAPEQAREGYAQHLFRDAMTLGIEGMQRAGRDRIYAFFDSEHYEPGLWIPQKFMDNVGTWHMNGADMPIRLLSIREAAQYMITKGKTRGDRWHHRKDIGEKVQALDLRSQAAFGDDADETLRRIFDE